LGAAALLSACPAVYPEIKTPMRDARAGQVLDPAPPSDVRWIAFKKATIPSLTRDGRRWGNELSSGLPDPYAKLLVNKGPLLETTVQRATLQPTWPDAPAGNFRLRQEDRFRVEIWDARVINDHPIGIRDIGRLDSADISSGVLDLETESGVRVQVAIEPAHARVGYGFFYELRTYDVYVTRVFEESPASRAGIRPGDQILFIGEKLARDMTEGEIRTAFNASRPEGVKLTIKRANGARVDLVLKEGAVYPLFREIGTFR
jgi:hypothetical protein